MITDKKNCDRSIIHNHETVQQSKYVSKWLSLVTFTIVLFSATGCGSDYETFMMKNESRTLDQCLASIKNNAKSPNLNIITDKPGEVSGFLQNDQHFSCKRKVTGTKGAFYEGTYMVKKKKN